MGYYTQFKLEMIDKTGQFFEIEDANSLDDYKHNDKMSDEMKKVADYLTFDDERCYGILSEETAKWYDCDIDMRNLSKKFPDLIFCLYGNGEESGDIWRSYYHNGKDKRQCIEMRFPDFDYKEWAKWTD